MTGSMDQDIKDEMDRLCDAFSPKFCEQIEHCPSCLLNTKVQGNDVLFAKVKSMILKENDKSK